MNFSLTIPGVFYDLIARVVPGFYATLLLRFFLPRTFQRIEATVGTRGDGVAALVSMLGLTIACYLAGWLLHGAAVALRLPTWGRPSPPDHLYDHYDAIKLQSEAVGYRLLKLRAEATMLEACIVATAFVLVVDLTGLFVYDVNRAAVAEGGIRALVYVAILVCLHSAYKPAWKRYFGVVESNYKLLCAPGAPATTT